MTIEARIHELATGEKHLEKVVVTKEFMARILARLEELQEPRHCPNWEALKGMDLVAWLMVPSRDKPFLTTAAFNLSRGETPRTAE
jgi:hypothetical protein